MKFQPKKKVGSPAAVKGVRGDYLSSLIMYIGAALVFILVVFVIPFPPLFQLLLVIITIILLIVKYNNLKKLSKGDIYNETKLHSRKKVLIISKPIKSHSYGKTDINQFR